MPPSDWSSDHSSSISPNTTVSPSSTPFFFRALLMPAWARKGVKRHPEPEEVLLMNSGLAAHIPEEGRQTIRHSRVRGTINGCCGSPLNASHLYSTAAQFKNSGAIDGGVWPVRRENAEGKILYSLKENTVPALRSIISISAADRVSFGSCLHDKNLLWPADRLDHIQMLSEISVKPLRIGSCGQV